MDLTPAPSEGLHLISSYGAGRFVVAEQTWQENILLRPDGVQPMGQQTIEDCDLLSLLSPYPELVIIGGGMSMQPMDAALKAALKAKFIATEPMDTGAACRTYNVLASEGRSIAAWLTLV